MIRFGVLKAANILKFAKPSQDRDDNEAEFSTAAVDERPWGKSFDWRVSFRGSFMRLRESSVWLAQLDGLRGVSILMVLTAHVYTPGWPHLEGRYGVTVFFVLSGFLITRLLLREEQETGAIDLLSFYVRRAFRLFPLYYLVLAAYCVLILGIGMRADGRQEFARDLLYYVVYLQEIPFFRDAAHSGGATSMPFGHSWSLGIEEKFYLLWPVVSFRLLRNQNARIALAACAVFLFCAARFVHEGRYIFPYAAISWGCLFALLYETTSIRNRFESWFSSWYRVFVVVLTWPLLQVVVASHQLPLAAQVAAQLAYPLSIAFVIIASLRSAWLARALSFGPLTVLGRYSYCIYLIHILVRQVVERILLKIGIGVGNGLLVYFLMMLLSTAAASILYHFIESKFREMGRRIARSWSGRANASIYSHPATLDTSH
jgi:peptidoglycan/LPS O-acetylase OafA/YrhL